MARKRIEEIVVDVVFEGADELKKLSGGFRELAKAIEPSDRLIEQARQRVVEFASGLGNSEQALKGQVKALQALRSQATIGGGVYRQLSADVNSLTSELKQLEKEFKAVGQAAQQTDKQIAAQFPARRPEAFRLQIAALRRELDKLSVSSREYGDQLTTITTRQLAFSRAQARQGVIAGAQSVGAPLIGAMTPQQQLPQTTAALRLRINELRQDLENTNYTLGEYRERLGQVRVLQQELDRATGDANETRKSEIRDRIANLRAINAENAALRERRAIRRSVERGRTGADTGPAPIERPMREISSLFQQIGQIGMQPIIGQIELMGKGYQEVAQDIRNATAASNGSIQSLQAQRGAWQGLLAQLAPSSKAYREISKELERVDRQLNRVQQRRRRMGAMGATQAAGAVISGGIFGGPEGAIGGAVGTAVGGVPGAFAGAAIGAQLGMIRKSLGAMAEFTAEIDKQRIALRNVVGTQQEYEKSLQFIDASSRRLAIPQDQLNKQFTQLSASVIGAGGNVDAAKMAFEGIAAGIRGTGGSLADMQSAMLATSQVFSKGKVSAEELRQQIGERLPGAFTIFAESIGKTPQELDKMLARGEVTLNDFMSFAQALSDRYGKSAEEIAASSQSAGDRMATTFARIREAVGRELQPVGAQFQETFAQFFSENEESIVGFARGLSAVITSLGSAAQAFDNFAQPIRDFIFRYPPLFTAFWRSIASDVSELSRKIQSIVDGIVNFWRNAWNILRSATRSALESIGVDADWLAGQFQRIISWFQDAWSSAFNFIAGRWRQTVENMVNYSNPLAAALKGLGINVGKAVADGLEAGFSGGALPSVPAAPAASGRPSLFTFLGGDIDGAGAGAGAGAKPPVDRTLELTEQLNLLIAVGEQEEKIRDLQFQGRTMLAILAEQDKARLQIEFDRVRELRNANYESERAAINEIALTRVMQLALETEQKLREEASKHFHEKLRIQEAVRGAIEPFRQLTLQQELQTQYAKTYSRLLAEGMLPAEAERIANFEKMVAEQFRSLDLQIDIAKAALAQAKLQGAYVVDLEKEVALLERKREAVAGAAAAGPGEGLSDADRIQSAVDASRAALNELVDPVNQIVGAATAIGDAFANSFKGLITGATSAREAMRNFFTSLADYFADMAAKMIAEALKMQAIRLLGSLLSGIAGAAGGAIQGAGSAAGASAFGGGGPSFNPSAFSMPNIMARAKGGPVTGKRPYIVGEEGPELFVPKTTGAIISNEKIYAATRAALAGAEQGSVAASEAELADMPNSPAASRLALQAGELNSKQAIAATRAAVASAEQGRSAASETGLVDASNFTAAGRLGSYGSASNAENAIAATRIQVLQQQAATSNKSEITRIEQMISKPARMDIRYESQVINSVEYVTRDQAERLAAESAQRGRELAIGALQSSVRTRKRVGIA